MTDSPPAALPLGAPPPNLFENELQGVLWIVSALVLSAFFATLRSALQHSRSERLLAQARNDAQRARLEPLMSKVDSLVASASVLKTSLDILLVALVMGVVGGGSQSFGSTIALTLAVAVPSILLFTEALPQAIAFHTGDRLLLRCLPTFYWVQLPLRAVVFCLDGLRRMCLRVLGIREIPKETRQVVEDLREVIEETEFSGELADSEREMIENVMEFRDVDVAAVMTPRTEIHGVEVEQGLRGAAEEAAACGHSRLPVYEGTLDTVIGTISARSLVQTVAEGKMDESDLRQVVHPPYFVPETKQVSDLLAEFRREKIKIAIVLDEYGGTAGLMTLGDIVAEIVGEVQDEFDEEAPQPIRITGDGVAEVLASLHVSEVNEALDLDLPEEADYETLGGYVLAGFGRFPKRGESFVEADTEFHVLEASDRRVLKVRVRKLTPESKT